MEKTAINDAKDRFSVSQLIHSCSTEPSGKQYLHILLNTHLFNTCTAFKLLHMSNPAGLLLCSAADQPDHTFIFSTNAE